MEIFTKEAYAKADMKRGMIMIISFLIAVFLAFIASLLPSALTPLGFLLLLIVLFAGIFLVRRGDYETKKGSDYLIVFMVTLLSYLGLWLLFYSIFNPY
ncbi:MAG: hypothetical protein M1515_00900 [Candidatus Thermoplasmatota archaeon]|jgi:hypothetical protein|nr:hypothetical protein [Candidatus Thermoplasmatota archaeon]